MQLKRIFDHTGDTPKVAGVKVLRAGRKQKFSQNVIQKGIMEGWLAMAAGTITITTQDGGKLVYKLVRAPGYYCSHCGVALESQDAARDHVAKEHAGVASPDPENPAGYMRTHSFKGILQQPPIRPAQPAAPRT